MRNRDRWLLRALSALFIAGALLIAHLHLTKALVVYVPLSLFTLWLWRRKLRRVAPPG